MSTLPATATLPKVPALPTTATLPAVPALPATATLAVVETLPATATLRTVQTLPATAVLPVTPALPATATLSATSRLPAMAESAADAGLTQLDQPWCRIRQSPSVAAAVKIVSTVTSGCDTIETCRARNLADRRADALGHRTQLSHGDHQIVCADHRPGRDVVPTSGLLGATFAPRAIGRWLSDDQPAFLLREVLGEGVVHRRRLQNASASPAGAPG